MSGNRTSNTEAGDYSQRSSRALMHTYNRIPIAFSRGEGAYLFDEEENRYLDFLAGIAVNALGYAHPKLTAALTVQAQKLWHCSNLFEIPSQTELAEKLIAHSDFTKVFFCNSGTEANEAALKLARKRGKQNGGAVNIVAMHKSFHGRTLGSLSVTGQEKYRKSFAPLLDDVGFIPFNDISALRETVNEDTCAVIIEPIQGEGGIHPAKKEFLQEAREICNKTGALLIFDEVQCGLGRTGTLFAYQQYGVKPDVVTLAKALGGGFPIGAVLSIEEAAVFEPGDHAATFGGGPLASTAALAVVAELTDGGVVENAAAMGSYLSKKLAALSEKCPRIKEVRGEGLMIGIELTEAAGPFMESCRENGLIVGKAGDNVLRLVPPLIIGRNEVDEAVDILEKVIC
ncbi:MAG: acetylornithine transaminase [Spirochaetia bacterium]